MVGDYATFGTFFLYIASKSQFRVFSLSDRSYHVCTKSR